MRSALWPSYPSAKHKTEHFGFSQTLFGNTHLGFPQEELKVPATQDAVVFDVARQMDCTGTVHCGVDIHVAVDHIQVFLLVLSEK